ncbi:MAG TPA: SGNH/GDSL hydrolase family protein, partial [Vicinamibacteria bacterium]|nr:SGNH/GDSL hydrolase family protein [Vicinamibacteria bacterium]
EGLTEVQARRLKSNIGLAAVIGLLLGFAHAWLTASLVSSEAGLPAGVAPATPLATFGSVILFVTSTALSAAGGYLVYERLLRPPRIGPDTTVGQHDLFLVDSKGRRLSEVPGDVAIVLDPFTGYRNAPHQVTSRVTTDENGFRGGIPAGDRPLAMVVGGSAAFGFGLESDHDTFTSVLNRLQARYRVVNTGATGFLSGQELGLMVHKLDDFHPKLYILFDGWNDLFFTQSFPHLRLHDFGFNWPIWGDIENRLHAQYLSQAPVSQEPTIPRLASPPRGDAENLQGAIAAYIENLRRMKAFADARGARLVVIFQPELLSKRTPTKGEVSLRKEFLDWAARPRVNFDAPRFSADYRVMIVAAGRACDALGLSHLDLNTDARFQENPEELFIDHVHFNARAHRQVAEILREELERGAPSP